jgi:C-22 sterol desaturase
MATNATTLTSPLATIGLGAVNVPQQVEYVLETIIQASRWQIFFTVLGLLVAYDQCMYTCPCQAFGDTALTPVEKVRYIWQKGSIVGPAWKMPFIGPFLQSVNPKFEEYYAKWASGPLSCVSVFHKYVNRAQRKVLWPLTRC